MILAPNRIHPQINKVNKGNTAIFNCRSREQVSWSYDSSHPRTKFYRKFDRNRILTIMNVQFIDAGIYRCYGNGTDIFKATAELKVIGMRMYFSNILW